MKYERLTPRFDKPVNLRDKICLVEWGEIDSRNFIARKNSITFEQCFNRLVELENKIDDGTLVEFPCKVGGIVYRIIGMPWRIEEQRVDCITISCDGKYEILNDGGDELEIDTLYRTKAEAEARLKELTSKDGEE